MVLPERDRRILAALQLSPRATWRQIAAATGLSEQLVASRGQALLGDGVVRISGQVDHLRCGLGISVFSRISCPPHRLSGVAERLAADPQTRFVCITAGGSDVFAEYVLKNHAQLQSAVARLPETVTSIDTAIGLRKFSAVEEWDCGVLSDEARAVLRPDDSLVHYDHQTWTSTESLSAQELALIGVLHRDGRAGYRQLAQETGLSESTVLRRIESLRRRGALRFRALVDLALVGLEVEFLQLVTVVPEQLTAVGGRLAGLRASQFVTSTTGSTNLLLFGGATDYSGLHDHTVTMAGSDGSIRAVDTLVVTKTLKHAWIPVASDGTQLAPADPIQFKETA